MKALVRDGDVLTEDMGVRSIDWETGQPLINPDWAGGPYKLVENYIPPSENEIENVASSPITKRDAEITELKARLAALENET